MKTSVSVIRINYENFSRIFHSSRIRVFFADAGRNCIVKVAACFFVLYPKEFKGYPEQLTFF